MILRAQMQTLEDKTVISALHCYASDQYGLLITVVGVGGDFNQTMARGITKHRTGPKHRS